MCTCGLSKSIAVKWLQSYFGVMNETKRTDSEVVENGFDACSYFVEDLSPICGM